MEAYVSALISIAVFAVAITVTDLALLRKARARPTLLDVLAITSMVALVSAVIMGSLIVTHG